MGRRYDGCVRLPRLVALSCLSIFQLSTYLPTPIYPCLVGSQGALHGARCLRFIVFFFFSLSLLFFSVFFSPSIYVSLCICMREVEWCMGKGGAGGKQSADISTVYTHTHTYIQYVRTSCLIHAFSEAYTSSRARPISLLRYIYIHTHA